MFRAGLVPTCLKALRHRPCVWAGALFPSGLKPRRQEVSWLAGWRLGWALTRPRPASAASCSYARWGASVPRSSRSPRPAATPPNGSAKEKKMKKKSNHTGTKKKGLYACRHTCHDLLVMSSSGGCGLGLRPAPNPLRAPPSWLVLDATGAVLPPVPPSMAAGACRHQPPTLEVSRS